MTDDQKAAWLAQRAGKLTASRMADAMDKTKTGKSSAARTRLMHELLAERLTGNSVPHFVNELMRWGLEQEPHAKDAFEAQTGELLMPCGFVDHPNIWGFGATPDGLLGRDCVVEFKCPQTVTHVAWKLAGGVPEQHQPQILAQLACTGRTRAVFVSFDPRCPEPQRLYVATWTPDAAEIAAVESAAREFLAEVEAMWDQLVTAPA